MIDKQLGPYTIEAELGSGGMGKVYRAKGPAGVVALKVVHPHLLESPGFFKRFLREAEIGKRVRHGNVVRTLDCDQLVLSGTPHSFLVMEYVEGKSLRELLNDLGTIPETLLRGIAVQAAAGLCAIHAAGIVHRDLKPENVLITHDHEIRIMDLGVAKLQEATISITREGQFAGSLPYAAPEQFGPAEVGPPADRYSLGVMLYELCTGDNPFCRDDAAGVIDAQLHFEAPRVTDYNGEISRFFAECVATLLSKRPADRFESTEMLHLVLEQGEKSAWWTELAPQLLRRTEHLPKIRVRRETKLHGRDEDLRGLGEAWERAKEGSGNTVYVEGEAGIGKTRLIDAFLQELPDKDVHVLYGSYPPSGGLGGISQAVLGKFGESRLADALERYLTVTPSLVPAFAALVKHESPPPGSEPLQGDALNAVCVHLMRALAGERPLIWVIDDLHFAPKESRDTVLALARAVEGHRVLLIATARPGVPDEEQAHLSRLENFERITLGRLSGRDVIDLLEDAFRSEALAEKLGVRIVKKSDGVPFFIFEMIRGLKEGQFIRQQPDGTYVQTQVIDEIQVPSAVKDLIEGRLRGLDKTQRRLLDLASVQGFAFDPELTAKILGVNTILALQEFAEIERRFGLVRDEGHQTCFDQNQIQEVVYRDLTPRLRAEYHTLLAEAHAERLDREPAGEDAVFVASHHLRGSRPQKGLPSLKAALEFLIKTYRNDVAIELAARALDTPQLVEGKERVEILIQKAGRHGLQGERELERAALDEALALADAGGDAVLRARVRNPLGWHLCQTSQYAESQRCLKAALELAREGKGRDVEITATGTLGTVFSTQNRFEEAREYYGKWLKMAREEGDRAGEARATGGLGNLLLNQDRVEEARGCYEEWLAMAREMGDRLGEGNATGNLGNVLARRGRYAEARAHHEKHLALAREIGDRTGEARATGNLGAILGMQGHYDAAQTQSERWITMAREIGDRRDEAMATGHRGNVFAQQGRYDEARADYERVLALAREIGARRAEAYALEGLGSVAERQGAVDEARRYYADALALRKEIAFASGIVATRIALGRLEATYGDQPIAKGHLGDALALAKELGVPDLILAATVERARLPDGDRDVALAALREHEEHATLRTRMNARFRLWELTGDRAHLEEAHRLLSFARDHAAEDCRTTILNNVPLHREIMRAWTDHGKTIG